MDINLDKIEDFYTINELAKKLRVHPNTIRNGIRQGRIAAFQLTPGRNSMYRIPASEVERLIMIKLDEAYENFKKEFLDTEV